MGSNLCTAVVTLIHLSESQSSRRRSRRQEARVELVDHVSNSQLHGEVPLQQRRCHEEVSFAKR
jgi:hypothetical protein